MIIKIIKVIIPIHESGWNNGWEKFIPKGLPIKENQAVLRPVEIAQPAGRWRLYLGVNVKTNGSLNHFLVCINLIGNIYLSFYLTRETKATSES